MFKSVLEFQVYKQVTFVHLFIVYLQKRDLSLEPEEQRLLERLLRDGKRNGLFKLELNVD